MVRYTQALKLILRGVKPLEWEWADVIDCYDRVLAENIIARSNIPYVDNSAMDGYAVKSTDLKELPCTLKIAGVVLPGKPCRKKLQSGEAMYITTGAPVPKGCDAVVPVEDTEKMPGGKVKIIERITPGRNIRYAGEDVKKGDTVLRKGQVVTPARLGMIASLGKTKVKVYRRPYVGILVTGNEIVNPGQRLRVGKVRDINTFSLSGLVKKYGGVPVPLGIAPDQKGDILKGITRGLGCDVLIVSGGVSMGQFDLVREVLSSLGYSEKFWKVAVRPGMPISFGHIGKVPVFGLPGNPVSSMVSFVEFVRPLIMKLLSREIDLPEVSAILKQTIEKKDTKRHFLRVRLDYRNGNYFASLTGPQGSGILKSMVECDGIAIFPENEKLLEKGDRIVVQLLK